MSPKSLDEIKSVLHNLKLQERLVIPGQVAREFAKNKSNKIRDLHHKLTQKKKY
jgi:hypothetical protein